MMLSAYRAVIHLSHVLLNAVSDFLSVNKYFLHLHKFFRSTMLMKTLLMTLTVLGAILLAEGQQATPKCDPKIIHNIIAYHKENCSFPSCLADGSKEWTFCYYTPGTPDDICMLEVVGDGNVTSILKNHKTDEQLLNSTVTFEDGLKCGMMEQTVQETNEKINFWLIVSNSRVNVHYACAPDSTETGAPLGGVAIPVHKSMKDDAVRAEAREMRNLLKEIGIYTVSVKPCKHGNENKCLT